MTSWTMELCKTYFVLSSFLKLGDFFFVFLFIFVHFHTWISAYWNRNCRICFSCGLGSVGSARLQFLFWPAQNSQKKYLNKALIICVKHLCRDWHWAGCRPRSGLLLSAWTLIVPGLSARIFSFYLQGYDAILNSIFACTLKTRFGPNIFYDRF